jgi:hypothetical protein
MADVANGSARDGDSGRLLSGLTKQTEIKVAAAAVTAAVSPPLGVAVAAGAALRSPEVRRILRRGTVRAVAGAMQLGDQLSAAVAQRATSSAAADGPAQPPTRSGSNGSP